MITIPVLDANDSQLEIVLDEQSFFLRMSWNSEGRFWVMSLEDYAQNIIMAGIRVVPDTELLEMYRHLPIPRGRLFALLMDETREDFYRSDFATGQASLIYLDEGEDVPL